MPTQRLLPLSGVATGSGLEPVAFFFLVAVRSMRAIFGLWTDNR